jgi:hypothetical protein
MKAQQLSLKARKGHIAVSLKAPKAGNAFTMKTFKKS